MLDGTGLTAQLVVKRELSFEEREACTITRLHKASCRGSTEALGNDEACGARAIPAVSVY